MVCANSLAETKRLSRHRLRDLYRIEERIRFDTVGSVFPWFCLHNSGVAFLRTARLCCYIFTIFANVSLLVS